MVGSLSLPNVCEGDPLDVMSCGADRGLDSPDSGLPPSPSPSAWLLPGTTEKVGGQGSEDEARVGGSALKVPSNFFFVVFFLPHWAPLRQPCTRKYHHQSLELSW